MASEATGWPRQLPAYLHGYQVSLPQSLMPYTAPNQDDNSSASAQQLQSLSLQTGSASQDGQLLSAQHSDSAAADKVSQWNTAPQVSAYPSLPTLCGRPPYSALSECSRQSHTLIDYCLSELAQFYSSNIPDISNCDNANMPTPGSTSTAPSASTQNSITSHCTPCIAAATCYYCAEHDPVAKLPARLEQICPDQQCSNDCDEETLWCLKFLLNYGADPVLIDSAGFSPVHYAAAHGKKHNLKLAYNGYSEALQVLLETMVHVDVQDSGGRTALYLACLQGHCRCVEVLLLHEASCSIREDIYRWTPLHIAAAKGQADCLLKLLKQAEQNDVINLKDKQGRTPLMLATRGSNTDCVNMLLERGSKPDTGERRNHTALHYAAVVGSEQCVSALLVHGAFILCRDFHGRSPLHLAASCGHARILLLLLEAAALSDPLDSLLDYRGYTPAHWAAYHDVLLHQARADFSVLDMNRNTALHLACRGVMWPLSPLHIAARNGLVTVVEVLLTRGARVLAKDEDGCTPALACAPNKDVADCLALIVSTMKFFFSQALR
ncbi:Serine/threonine-protein phosphatase 6 regulatory ankyrin repeat subunit C [Triplophysa tibetana]|uniref:Serine/threonine-protein phosphatase 6 regulatory ankyrin repeat subunit C n=1 Tax=Triplophysa tibetana TaxID=1572043 RepID=A0A5A9NI03_9TELE|nr:Serine/threonine-protein phosphatase 6 regulatory ankyrin repeat subunit C [Triplophysa tibetana]